MIPTTPVLTEDITETTYASRTYKITFGNERVSTIPNVRVVKDVLILPKNCTELTVSVTDSVLSLQQTDKQYGYTATLVNDECKVTKAISGETNAVTDVVKMSGYIDGIEAVKQAIYLILSTERYQYIIYSWDYGVELLDLFGKPMPYVMSEVPRRIKDALTQDDRIEDVVDFTFKKDHNKLHTTFTVVTTYGDISTELEVAV